MTTDDKIIAAANRQKQIRFTKPIRDVNLLH